MFTKRELVASSEYWMDQIQNDLFRILVEYQEKHDLSQGQLADRLGYSPGYISQLLNGRFNHSTQKLIDLSLKVGKVPVLRFEDLESYVDREPKIVWIGGDNSVPMEYRQLA